MRDDTPALGVCFTLSARFDQTSVTLSGRDTVLLWDGDGWSPLRPPWVVADVTKREFTFKSKRQCRQRVALLEHSGYRVVFDRSGYIVLRRGGAGPSQRAAG
jgi:hypothetical protein